MQPQQHHPQQLQSHQCNSIVRPTEAQIRWAQFHFHKKQLQRQESIQRLYVTPESIQDVMDAITDDDRTSSSSDASNDTSRRRQSQNEKNGVGSSKTKPKKSSKSVVLSKGRRALLRVSKRQYEHRRQQIIQDGYIHPSCNDVDNDEYDENDSESVEDVLATIFAEGQKARSDKTRRRQQSVAPESSSRRRIRRRRQYRHGMLDQEEERIRRFEDAFNAMMLTTTNNDSNNNDSNIDNTLRAKKKWTRPDGVVSYYVVDDVTNILRQVTTTKNNQYKNKNDNSSYYYAQALRDEQMLQKRQQQQRRRRQYDEQGLVRNEDDGNDDERILYSNYDDYYDDNETTVTGVQRWLLDDSNRGYVRRMAQQMEHAIRIHDSKQEQLSPPAIVVGVLRRYFEEQQQQILAQHKHQEQHFDSSKNSEIHDDDEKSYMLLQYLIDNVEVLVVPEDQQLQHDETNDQVMIVDMPTLENLVALYYSSSLDEYEQNSYNGSDDNDSTPAIPTQQHENDNNVSSIGRMMRMMMRQLPSNTTKKYNSNDDEHPAGTTQRQQEEEENDRLQAYAAFRQARQKIHHGIKNVSSSSESNIAGLSSSVTSSSSLSLLPDGLRNVMNSFHRRNQKYSDDRSDQQQQRDHEDYDDISEHKQVDTMLQVYHDNDDEHAYNDDDGDDSYYSTGGSKKRIVAQFSPEKVRHLVGGLNDAALESRNMMDDRNIIDTDGSEVSTPSGANQRMHPDVVASLLLSPTILTKRHQQAIRAIETRSWDQVTYLLSANPWLAEMTDINTNSYLLHKLAFYGAGQIEVDGDNDIGVDKANIKYRYHPSPEELNIDLIRMFPTAVHKFDQDGNVPLHWAASSANMHMMELLGQRFPEGASVRNHNGMLPLHLAVLACASPISATLHHTNENLDVTVTYIIKSVLRYFPGAIAVPDNEGNLPIHLAASVLRGPAGAEIINCLIDEAIKRKAPFHNNGRSNDGDGIRFIQKAKNQSSSSSSKGRNIEGLGTDPSTIMESPIGVDRTTKTTTTNNCLLVQNEYGDTPLIAAIKSKSGWEVIEALTSLNDAASMEQKEAATEALAWEGEINIALQLLVNEPYKDPASVISLLKAYPEAAAIRNDEGILPIEFACMQMFPREVVLSIVVLDLPIVLHEKSYVQMKDGFGASWWYINCDCDDFYFDVVEDVISLCSLPQVRAMCFMKKDGDDKVSLLSRATPRCRAALQSALRFVNRYEFVDSQPIESNPAKGLQIFDALDFGTTLKPIPNGKRVLLSCYSKYESFIQETHLLQSHQVDFDYVEEILTFTVGGDYWSPSSVGDSIQKYFVAIECFDLTLVEVVRGLRENELCQTDPDIRARYVAKVFTVLRVVAKSLQYLHSIGLVHCNVTLANCAKYDNIWKLAHLLGSQAIGHAIQLSAFPTSTCRNAPPESFVRRVNPGSNRVKGVVAVRDDMIVSTAIDSWAFGKLAFEVLVGQSLFCHDGLSIDEEDDDDENRLPRHSDNSSLLYDEISAWNDYEDVRRRLLSAHVLPSGVDLIVQCLSLRYQDRPSMDVIMKHPVWKDLRRNL